MYGAATGMDPTIHTNGTFRRGERIVVKPGRKHGGQIGVIHGITRTGTLLATLDWLGITYPFRNEDLRRAS